MSATAPQDKPQSLRITRGLTYHFLAKSTWRLGKTVLPLTVEGRENIPLEGPVVFACNHQSFLDIPVLASVVPRHISFVARATLAKSKVIAFVMEHCGAVLIKRGEADHSALRGMVAHLQAGDSLCVFPEGTRSRDGSLGEFRRGALLAARRGKAQVIPVGITGSFEAWPPGQAIPHPHRMGMRFGTPVDPKDKNALEMVRDQVASLIAKQ